MYQDATGFTAWRQGAPLKNLPNLSTRKERTHTSQAPAGAYFFHVRKAAEAISRDACHILSQPSPLARGNG
jgi:hypothetical protein